MTGMGFGSFGGVFGGTMEAPVSGVYGAVGAPPGDPWPLWILLFLLQAMVSMKKKQNMTMTSKMWKCDDSLLHF
jgi:hypothetical protein